MPGFQRPRVRIVAPQWSFSTTHKAQALRESALSSWPVQCRYKPAQKPASEQANKLTGWAPKAATEGLLVPCRGVQSCGQLSAPLAVSQQPQRSQNCFCFSSLSICLRRPASLSRLLLAMHAICILHADRYMYAYMSFAKLSPSRLHLVVR